MPRPTRRSSAEADDAAGRDVAGKSMDGGRRVESVVAPSNVGPNSETPALPATEILGGADADDDDDSAAPAVNAAVAATAHVRAHAGLDRFDPAPGLMSGDDQPREFLLRLSDLGGVTTLYLWRGILVDVTSKGAGRSDFARDRWRGGAGFAPAPPGDRGGVMGT